MNKRMYSKIFDDDKGTYIYPFRTICEMHRELYDVICVAHSLRNWDMLERAVGVLEEAYESGVKMTKKLVEYKCEVDEGKQIFTEQTKEDMPNTEIYRLRSLRVHLAEELKRIQGEAGSSLRQK